MEKLYGWKAKNENHKEMKNTPLIEGYWDIEPEIKSISFPVRGKIQVALVDGRVIIMPISAFPSIKKVPVNERNNWYLTGGGFTWDSCPEVIHIEQVLGNFQRYSHER